MPRYLFQNKYICKEPILDEQEQIVQINFLTIWESTDFLTGVIEETIKINDLWVLNRIWNFKNLKLFSKNYDSNSYLTIYFTYDEVETSCL